LGEMRLMVDAHPAMRRTQERLVEALEAVVDRFALRESKIKQ
jgi:hypothetical protein